MPRIEASERDISIIQRIYDYCCDIATTHAEFGRSKERFMMTRTYQNAVGMCVLQIGDWSSIFLPSSPKRTPPSTGALLPAQEISTHTTTDVWILRSHGKQQRL